MSQAADDSFELYDLRVEAVIPEGARVYCGAKPGDYFELRGEMLSLPLGQGFSIYSLAAVLPLLNVCAYANGAALIANARPLTTRMKPISLITQRLLLSRMPTGAIHSRAAPR